MYTDLTDSMDDLTAQTTKDCADALEAAYRALLDATDPQATLWRLTTGRVVLLSDAVWDKIGAALGMLSLDL